MNSYNANNYLPLVQALAEGKLQRAEVCGAWRDIPKDEEVHFSDPWLNYRIKPEPRELWQLWAIHAGTGEEVMVGQFSSYEAVKAVAYKHHCATAGQYRLLYFREVV